MSVKRTRELAVLSVLMFGATACGGDKPVTRKCDEHILYKEAREHRRVESPDGMTPLDPDQEMVLPEPSPQPGRPADAPCLDLPPSVLGPEEGDSDDDSAEAEEENEAVDE